MSFLVFLLGLLALLFILGFLSVRYEKSVHPVKLTGPLAAPSEWLPEAMDRAARGGIIGWAPHIEAVLDPDGEVVGLRCELRSTEGDTILVDVPAFPAGDYTDSPMVAEIVIGSYTVSSVRGAEWFGTPAAHVTRRWRRVRRVLKRHARRSIQAG
ncbi:hypothetical protein DFP74_0025 [Nocardiopsis sp. Huas11]|uniref:hypothetical protein n=1 Tax=Nocardiopsis sp. Huas11 TaxID=2183912 RepID=UPI000EB1F530|nr:hypothetical protein [Nocardiopsis sp. Huas11]RKS04468.1 hypothetical protein DFP74_0025 [Nocardiopsis sp. Huas11]